MKILLVRHGQSKLNAEKRHQHHTTPLSEHGQKQAELVGQVLRQYSIDAILVSKQTRAIETANIINNYLHKPIEQNQLLNEIRRPTVIIGKAHIDPQVLTVKAQMKSNFHQPEWRHSDEENFFDLKQRALSFLDQVTQLADKNYLVVSHGMFIRVVLGIMLNGAAFSSQDYLEFETKFETENTCISICEYQDGDWKVHTMCDASHLSAYSK
jgi:broad specificity phosphatase PhoE